MKDTAYEIALHPKYNEYQGKLASVENKIKSNSSKQNGSKCKCATSRITPTNDLDENSKWILT